ncbi:chromatin target of PRMT1 protein-like [Argiope bruennichi]|uniref:Chromatin target of PRMT1 protein like n=1 Tax=Argiope bruennichi TaxID=94029 RepID=A0A8T0F4H3_ARGBR|nr:chromatin target of PRMT1 protein-like [Argiope bruennichi]KAF8786106.1 Chromatin target of PRMT1 protein like [Argiope bruennichi]
MATPITTKIVLKNTTKMSLNERFTAYRAEAQSAANTYRQKIQMQRQATSANLRLAQQMANRPTVIAALRLKKRSLQQRLGRRQQSASNVKARLNLSGKRLTYNSLQGRLGAFRGRGANRRGGFKPGTSPLLKARLGTTTRSFSYASQPNQRLGFRKRGNFQGGNRQARVGNRLQIPRNGRGGRSNRGGGGRGRLGKGRWGKDSNAVLPTKQELDNQLDEYMAETKGSLDAQLGQYMSQE